MDISSSLNYLMEKRGITNYRLAKDIGCSPTSVANWRSGKEVTLEYISKIAEYFRVSVDHLLGWDDYSKPIEFSIQTSELQDYLNNKKAPIQEDERGHSNIYNMYNLHDYSEVAKIAVSLPSKECINLFDKNGYDLSFDSESRHYIISDRRVDYKMAVEDNYFCETEDTEPIEDAKMRLDSLNHREMYTLYEKYNSLSKSDKKIVDMILNMRDEEE